MNLRNGIRYCNVLYFLLMLNERRMSMQQRIQGMAMHVIPMT